MTGLAARRVAPFGHPGITARVQLPQAYRSLPRPSSPLDAKASTVCLIAFDLKLFVQPGRTRCAGVCSVLISMFPDATRLAAHRVVTPSGTSIVKERRKSEQEVPGVRATSETLSAPYHRPRPADGLTRDLQKGGDPAAGSPTATLLRLRPSHCARLRPLGPLRVPARTSGAHSFHGVTGGVYKARERIHRGMADPRLLAIPASCSRVADGNPNLDRFSGIRSPSRVCRPLYRPL